MAIPRFTTDDIQKLFAGKFIVVIGDSVQRSVYKDLVCLLNSDNFLKAGELREKGEESFQGDKLLEGGVKSGLRGTNYREVRKFTRKETVVMFYYVTHCFNEYMVSILDAFKEVPPDVIIMNSCLWDLSRGGRAGSIDFMTNIRKFFETVDSVVSSDELLFIWNASLPVQRTVDADYLPPGVTAETSMGEDIRRANLFVRDELEQFGKGFIFLDLHQVFYLHLSHRAKDGLHWDNFAHRKITCLLLREISIRWNYKIPSLTQPTTPSESLCDYMRSPPEASRSPANTVVFDEQPDNFIPPQSAIVENRRPQQVNVPARTILHARRLLSRDANTRPNFRLSRNTTFSPFGTESGYEEVPRYGNLGTSWRTPRPFALPQLHRAPFRPSRNGFHFDTPPLPTGWLNRPRVCNHNCSSNTTNQFGSLLNTAFDPFPRKRKYVQDNDFIDTYKCPRKFM